MMAAHGRAVYEESVTGRLIADLLGEYRDVEQSVTRRMSLGPT